MQQHRFRLGEQVELVPTQFSARTKGDNFTVLRLLPNDAADREYRVQCGRDGHERVVRESEMRASASTLLSRTWPTTG